MQLGLSEGEAGRGCEADSEDRAVSTGESRKNGGQDSWVLFLALGGGREMPVGVAVVEEGVRHLFNA